MLSISLDRPEYISGGICSPSHSAHLRAFAAMSFLLIVVPGSSVLFVIGRALAQGAGPR